MVSSLQSQKFTSANDAARAILAAYPNASRDQFSRAATFIVGGLRFTVIYTRGVYEVSHPWQPG